MCIKVSSWHVTPRPYVLDQGWTPNFHMDLTWRQNISRCRNLYRNTCHCSFVKLEICFAHYVFKLRNAWHKRLYFSVNRRTCLNFALCVSPQDSAFDMRKRFGAYRIKKHVFSISCLMNLKKLLIFCEILVPTLFLSNALNVIWLMKWLFFWAENMANIFL